MFSTFQNLKIQIDGASHSERITLVLNGVRKGERIDLQSVQKFVDKRRPGNGVFSTPRKESDTIVWESGFDNGVTNGDPIIAHVLNNNQHSADYEELKSKPRPSHADYAARVKFGGEADLRGGGKFSGRMTVATAIAGGIAKQILSNNNIEIGAYVSRIGKIKGKSYNEKQFTPGQIEAMEQNKIKTFDSQDAEKMLNEISAARDDSDSVGGTVECMVFNMPSGRGDSLFGGMESRISSNVFAIPAVKGVGFGRGFGVSEMLGSECNDEFYYDENFNVKTYSNNNGGINGGITNGMPITLSVAFKPTPSIGKEQRTIDLENKINTTIKIKGRHDSCIVPRAVPVVEAAVALTVLDAVYDED